MGGIWRERKKVGLKENFHLNIPEFLDIWVVL